MEQRIIAKGTQAEKDLLASLYKKATEAAGEEHSEFSSNETTDEGIMEAASLMSAYRKLVADILHREEKNVS